MKATILDPIALKAISPLALRAYVDFEGWRRIEPFGKLSEVYSRENGSGSAVEIIVPVTDQIGDYASVVGQLISIVSREEARDELVVYRDLTQADRDVVRFRSPHAEDDGSIDIEAGIKLVDQARNALAAAACSANEPKQSYHVGKIQKVTEYMQRVRLGQTETGSFVVTLLAPVPPTLEPKQGTLWPEISLEPYDRQVTRVLASGLQATSDALAAINRGRDISAFEERVNEGVSANLCEAIAGIAERSDGADVSITWARTRPTPIQRSRVLFSRKDADPLYEVARHFRLREPRDDVTLLGNTTKLQRSGRQLGGNITFATFIDDRPRSVTVSLPKEDYERAVDAHRRRQPIIINGDLHREGQRWHLRNPRNLIVSVPDES